MPIFEGPSDVLEYDGKFYRPGDNVPMNDESVEHHVVFAGLRFKDYEAKTGRPLPVLPGTLAMPHDDRGQAYDIPEETPAPTTRVHRTAATTGDTPTKSEKSDS